MTAKTIEDIQKFFLWEKEKSSRPTPSNKPKENDSLELLHQEACFLVNALSNDKTQGKLTEDELGQLINALYCLLEATESLDLKVVKEAHEKFSEKYTYSEKLSLWTVIIKRLLSKDTTLKPLQKEVSSLIEGLICAEKQDNITKEKRDQLIDTLYDLLKATKDVNLKAVKEAYEKFNQEYTYTDSEKCMSLWTVIIKTLLLSKDATLKPLQKEVSPLIDTLILDEKKGYITKEKRDQLIDTLYDLLKATKDVDLDAAKKAHETFSRECIYNVKLMNGWMVIGGIIGVLVAVAVTITLFILVPELAIPAFVVLLNAGLGALVMGGYGATFGHQLEELGTKDKMDSFVHGSVCNFFKTQKTPGAKTLDNSMSTRIKRCFGLESEVQPGAVLQ